MSEQLISQVGNVQIDAARVVQNHNQAAVVSQEMVNNVVDGGRAVRRIESDEKYGKQDTKKEVKREREPQKMVDVLLKFQIDKETKDITVYVLDRASKEVIRTIPADDLSKMSAGQLIELFI